MIEEESLASPRSQIESTVAEAVDAALQSIAKTDDSLLQAASHDGTNLHLIFNSSFLYRDKRTLRTLQSSRRLVTRLTSTGKQVRADAVWIADDLQMKGHYKISSQGDLPDKTSMSEAIGQELGSIGDLIFVLIGTVKGLRAAVAAIKDAPATELRLDPSITHKIERVATGIYAVKKIVPIEDLLRQISDDFNGQGGLTEPERWKIAEAYEELLDGAITDVIIPIGSATTATETILGKIVSSLQSQTSEYRAAVKALSSATDKQALIEVLRIAYNFSTDVLPLIYLFMSICDLKPLIFWCTINRQWALYRAFASLPWSALGRKEKLDEYKSIVAQARNHAFHHVLPFDATVEVDLSGFDVRAEKIRLFSTFGRKQERGVQLKDQQLADVLADFSRAQERPVSTLFWVGNLDVMEAACELSQGILDALILIHTANRK